MFDGHRLLRSESSRVGGTAILGLFFAVYASIGYPTRRRGGHSPLDFAYYTWLEVVGFGVAAAVTCHALIRWLRLGQKLAHLEVTENSHFFLRAGVPRTIYALLLQVAARDGTIDAWERDIVHRVLLHELTDRVLPSDLRNWNVAAAQGNPIALARTLQDLLQPPERLAVLRWCREVAAADCTVVAEESALLRDLARVLAPPRG